VPASPAIAGALQKDFVGVVSTVMPSVVVIETTSGLGSGIVFDTKGDIVTNDHVVAGSTKFTVILADGQKLAGTLVGTYPAGDLAVIHVTGTNLKPATFGDSSKLVAGDIVLAVGSPLGLQGSVTEGIVSAIGRKVAESKTVTLPDVIQTSAEINPGNSGGALVDLAGEVVGIPTLTALDPELGNTAAAGIGFAIPSNVVVDVAGQLIAHGRVVTPPSPNASPAAS
jgi:S1-C subfamily serine protease